MHVLCQCMVGVWLVPMYGWFSSCVGRDELWASPEDKKPNCVALLTCANSMTAMPMMTWQDAGTKKAQRHAMKPGVVLAIPCTAADKA